MRIIRRLLPLVLVGVACASAAAEVSLPALFADGMVLQRGMNVPVWGRAAPGETVTVAFAGQEHAAVADDEGRWRVTLDPLSCPDRSAGRELTVRGSTTVTVKDVLVGEVWLCSGQSNMEWGVGGAANAAEEIAAAKYPLIRQFRPRHAPAGGSPPSAPACSATPFRGRART